MSLEDLVARLESEPANVAAYPVCHWSDEGECCFLYLENPPPYYADRSNPYFHLYRSQADNRIVGGVLFPNGLVVGELVYKKPESPNTAAKAEGKEA